MGHDHRLPEARRDRPSERPTEGRYTSVLPSLQAAFANALRREGLKRRPSTFASQRDLDTEGPRAVGRSISLGPETYGCLNPYGV